MTPLKIKRRKQILEAALVVFSRDGYHKGTVSDIAKQADIGKGTIYEYFSSKKNIFEEMIVYALDYYILVVREGISSKNTAYDKLKFLLDFNIAFIDQHLEVMKKVFFSIDNVTEEFEDSMQNFRDSVNQFVLELIEMGIENGEINKNINPDTASLVIINMIYSLSGEIAQKDFKEPINTEEIITLLFNGIG